MHCQLAENSRLASNGGPARHLRKYRARGEETRWAMPCRQPQFPKDLAAGTGAAAVAAASGRMPTIRRLVDGEEDRRCAGAIGTASNSVAQGNLYHAPIGLSPPARRGR